MKKQLKFLAGTPISELTVKIKTQKKEGGKEFKFFQKTIIYIKRRNHEQLSRNHLSLSKEYRYKN